MAALVLGALCQIGDKTPWLAAILADRFRSPALVIAAMTMALAANYALGVVGGILVAPLLTPEAKQLLLALALLFAGLGAPFRNKAPDRLENWRIGAVATSILGLAIMALGDRMQFVTAALAARSPMPWLAAIGATIGALAVATPAILLGEAKWQALPLRPVRIAAAAILTIAGLWIGLTGLRLI
ncbi:TMEM165/GDT1 family protein [Sphingomonas sp. SUN019]|uniref:TMEM165/GDT1 family protein n=1 Tax=Sphingomonas sp. SUN019 TaxID=2937788 RepID=UPI00216455DD|nr:TMEM165/GDT1 family protein [Sphingomonas sp. SUN019]UVO51408.1 TMEM165/GDT1 family protein [Sphingomonas sp. SUN019]